MSGGISAAALASYATIAASAFSVINGLTNKPKQPNAPDPMKPPAETKTPDADVFKARNQQQGGMSPTLLTAMGGVPNSTLNLGRNTLLGA